MAVNQILRDCLEFAVCQGLKCREVTMPVKSPWQQVDADHMAMLLIHLHVAAQCSSKDQRCLFYITNPQTIRAWEVVDHDVPISVKIAMVNDEALPMAPVLVVFKGSFASVLTVAGFQGWLRCCLQEEGPWLSHVPPS
jgi:hypothetical protein